LHPERVVFGQVLRERMLRFPDRILCRLAHGYQKVVLLHVPPITSQ
jgi:hypothetical protein